MNIVSAKTPQLDSQLFRGLDQPSNADYIVTTQNFLEKDAPKFIIPPSTIDTSIIKIESPTLTTSEIHAPVVSACVPPSLPTVVVDNEVVVTKDLKPIEIDITAPVIHIDLPKQQTTTTAAAAAVSPTKKSSTTHTSSPNKLSCLTCGGSKDKIDVDVDQDLDKSKAPITKPLEPKFEITTPDIVVKEISMEPALAVVPQTIGLDASSDMAVIVDVKTPPKKPPRGNLDTSLNFEADVSSSGPTVDVSEIKPAISAPSPPAITVKLNGVDENGEILKIDFVNII